MHSWLGKVLPPALLIASIPPATRSTHLVQQALLHLPKMVSKVLVDRVARHTHIVHNVSQNILMHLLGWILWNADMLEVLLLLLLQNPDDMYAELLEQLDAVEGQLPLAAVSHIKPKDRGMEGDKDKEKQQERERQKEREKAQAAKAQLAARGGLYALTCCMSGNVPVVLLSANYKRNIAPSLKKLK